MYKQFNQNNMNTKSNTNLIPYKRTASLIGEKAKGLIIKTDSQIKEASDILFQISDFAKRIKAEREKVTNPAKAIIAWARSAFGPIESQCKDAELIIKSKMVSFSNQKEQKRLKKLANIAEKVSSGKMDLEKASESIEAIKPSNAYSGDVGGVQFREHKTVVITNESLLPRKYLIPDAVKIRLAVLAGDKIPGAELRVEKIVAKKEI